MEEKKSQAFDVFRGKKWIDTVFYSASCKVTKDEVKKSLIEHDGYPDNIEIIKKR